MTDIPAFPLDRPAMRPLEVIPVQHEGRQLLLVRDPMEVMAGMAALPPDPVLLTVLQTANGERSIAEIAEMARDATGMIVTVDNITHIVQELDEALMLWSDRFLEKWNEKKEEFRNLPVRRSRVFQSEDKLLLLKEMGDEFRRHARLPDAPPERLDLPNPRVRAVLAPHIDYQRGGAAYAWAYKAIADHTSADTYIILGTLHKPSAHPFIATAKSFETPLGTVEVDTELLAELEKEFDGELFDEEYHHLDEHTIELEVVYLQHVLKDRPFKILPILVGSFEEFLLVEPKTQPSDHDEISRFVKSLRAILDRRGDRVALIGGVDFSHRGREFGDEELNTQAVADAVREKDHELLRHIEATDAEGFFDAFRADLNERKVCSIAPIYCILSALNGTHEGKTLIYKQANNEEKTCMVTFAGVAFTSKGSRIITL